MFDLFGDGESASVRYDVTTWQYGSATRVTSPGGTWDTLDEAKQAAQKWACLASNTFTDKTRNLDDYAGIAYRDKLDLVVISRVDRDEVVSSAPLTPGWIPTIGGFKPGSGA